MDLTVIYYTSNKAPESFVKETQKHLLKATSGLYIISVSQKPINFGENICVGEIGNSSHNIYKQLLIGAKAAKTKYIACAEDDVLYGKKHFKTRLPSQGRFLYDQSRWSIHTWNKPAMFGYKVGRRVLHQMICERNLLIEALEERFAKHPKRTKFTDKWFGEPGRYEKALGVKVREVEDFKSWTPSVVFSHPTTTEYAKIGDKKALGPIKAIEIPYWGRADDMVALYK